MKPTRPLRPAPRTLAAQPPPQVRSPHGAAPRTAFPALAAALAGGVLLPACESPQCGDTRGDELERHGRAGSDALRSGRAGDAIEEIGVALGVVRHGSTTRGQVAGGVRMVTPPPQLPPQVPEIPIATAGGPMRVLPQVAQPQPPPTTTTPPRPPTTTAPHHPVTRPPVAPPQDRPRNAGAPRRATPTPPSSARGGLAMASPLPADLQKP